ncbi:hypothetical protein [Homoserinimonas hongtaonis]|uniref:Uncharacterized protein n=1 Tax=Homoserinimonas hongtaonis TaxID=2079791 RepID=A0A2U1T0Z4_9MICO|nr:hypothetical protein [Salinibacterium hongtaonis]AWB90097.1 hypothetical protein C2138_11585 [Salinibacterium hongtaonis]PWB97551.1 hypothetical protein DF220_06700 [Salinibacterium hongtaonis]
MTDKLSADNPGAGPGPKSPRYSRRLVAILAAGALVLAGGITAVSVGVARATAEEAARQCATALKDSAAATKSAGVSVASSDQALVAVTSIALPGDEGWESTAYAERPGVEAVDAVAAVDAVEAVPAASGRGQ